MGAYDKIPNCNTVLERPGPGKVFARQMGRKSCRSVQLLWAAPFTGGCTGFSPCPRTCQQSLLSGCCHSALYLQCLGLSQAVTAQQERHIPSTGKVHKTLRHSVVISPFSSSKMSYQKLSKPAAVGSPISQLSCIAAAMSYS